MLLTEPYGINEKSIDKEFKEVDSKDTDLLNSFPVFFEVCHWTFSVVLLPTANSNSCGLHTVNVYTTCLRGNRTED